MILDTQYNNRLLRGTGAKSLYRSTRNLPIYSQLFVQKTDEGEVWLPDYNFCQGADENNFKTLAKGGY